MLHVGTKACYYGVCNVRNVRKIHDSVPLPVELFVLRISKKHWDFVHSTYIVTLWAMYIKGPDSSTCLSAVWFELFAISVQLLNIEKVAMVTVRSIYAWQYFCAHLSKLWQHLRRTLYNVLMRTSLWQNPQFITSDLISWVESTYSRSLTIVDLSLAHTTWEASQVYQLVGAGILVAYFRFFFKSTITWVWLKLNNWIYLESNKCITLWKCWCASY